MRVRDYSRPASPPSEHYTIRIAYAHCNSYTLDLSHPLHKKRPNAVELHVLSHAARDFIAFRLRDALIFTLCVRYYLKFRSICLFARHRL